MRKNFRKKKEKLKEEMKNVRGKTTEKKLRTFVCLFVCFLLFTFANRMETEISTGKKLKSQWEKIGKSDFPLPEKKIPVKSLLQGVIS